MYSLEGFTESIYIRYGAMEGVMLIKKDTDLSGEFDAYDPDNKIFMLFDGRYAIDIRDNRLN